MVRLKILISFVEQSAVPGLCPLGIGNGTSILINEEILCERELE